MSNSYYLRTFFVEKNLPFQMFEIEHEGLTHFISSPDVIDLILRTSDQEQEVIANQIRKIDFLNGDVMHYLKHCATAYIRNSSNGTIT